MSKYEQFPLYLKLLIAIPLGVIFILYSFLVFDLPWTSPYKYLSFLFYLPVYSFVFMPILTVIKAADFKSELLFVTKDQKKNYAIHFGSFFDCLLSGLFTGRVGGFKDNMMFFLAEGLLNLAKDVESGEIPKEAEIKGSSYFFNERTAAKFGFTKTKTLTSHKYILILNIVEIGFVYSMSQGKLAFPNFSDFKTIKTTGAELLEHKPYIEELTRRLGRKLNREI